MRDNQRVRWRIQALLILFGMTCLRAAEPVRYTVRFSAPITHYAEVECVFPVEPGARSMQLFLPVWTPGSYLVREYARNLESVRARDEQNRELPVEKTSKNRWKVDEIQGSPVHVTYRVYSREMTVRTNWVDEQFALLNGAPTFMAEVEKLNREHDVVLVLPTAWKSSISGMEQTAPNQFRAANYDVLVDSPILAGNPGIHEFEVAGKKHFLVNQGETALWDSARTVRDVRKIVEQNLQMWGSLPYEKYVFLNLIVGEGGGLEHRNSFCIMTSRYATRTHKEYLGWLGLVSHEYFHAWNVKRLRPVELGPFDYENENYTSNLWFAEGFTEYYGALNVRRAGLSSVNEYLGTATTPPEPQGLSRMIERLETSPGRLAQPLASASFDAWIKLYRPDENSINSSISYYLKGAVIAWLLDAHIRHITNGAKSLDDGMRLAYTKYSGEHGYSTADLIKVMDEISGADLNGWFQKMVYSTDSADYSEALRLFGLRFKQPAAPNGESRPKGWSGFQTGASNGRLFISAIPRGTPAAGALLSVDDEILAVDGWRVAPEEWNRRLEQYAPGDTVELLISRRDRIESVPLKLGQEPARKWILEVDPGASAEQKAHRTAWLGPA